jgi:hypothetical protein
LVEQQALEARKDEPTQTEAQVTYHPTRRALGAVPVRTVRAKNSPSRAAVGPFGSSIGPGNTNVGGGGNVGNNQVQGFGSGGCTLSQIAHGTCTTSGGGGGGGGGGGPIGPIGPIPPIHPRHPHHHHPHGGGSGGGGGGASSPPFVPPILPFPLPPAEQQADKAPVVTTTPGPTNYVCPDGTTVPSADQCLPIVTVSPSAWDTLVTTAKSIPWWVYVAGGVVGYKLLRKKNS